ncbi:MED6-domain-containing protein [Ramaria rubella]|nr:MED6-domain-containing protein [Ramaria rubella]
MDSSHPQDDFSSRFFIWHEWIQANGPLTAQNALDYFATSMFYDKQSNNQVLRMQTMHTGMPLENEAEELKRFTGVEFALVHDEAPTLFIIHKRDRLSHKEVQPLAAYFIMYNRIYQAPDVYNIVSNRLLAALSSLQASLGTLLSHKPDFTPRMGYLWPIAQAKSMEDSEPSSKKPHGVENENSVVDQDVVSAKRRRIATKKQENAALLFNAMRTTAAQAIGQLRTPLDFQNQSSVSITTDNQPENTRSSATPSLSAIAMAPQLEDGLGKPPPGGGKKRKKRERSYCFIQLFMSPVRL